MFVALNRLSQNVIWPAIAGSILWSFVTMVVKEGVLDQSVIIREVLMLTLAVYLLAQWLHTEYADVEPRFCYWLSDIFLATSIIFVAILAEANYGRVVWPIVGAFAIGIAAHIGNFWQDRGSKRHWFMAALHAIGLLIILVCGLGLRFSEAAAAVAWANFAEPKKIGWSYVFAVAVVIAGWALSLRIFPDTARRSPSKISADTAAHDAGLAAGRALSAAKRATAAEAAANRAAARAKKAKDEAAAANDSANQAKDEAVAAKNAVT